MKVNVEEISPIERKLSIEVEPAQIDEELRQAYAKLGQEVKVPGFRPGKVPRRILEQRYRKQVEADVTQRLVELSYLRAVTEHKVDVVSNPQVKNSQPVKPGQPFSFEALVEIKPKVEPKDYRGLALKALDTTVDDAKVLERLEQMRSRMATLQPVEGREVAKAGDFAVVDYEGTQGGSAFEGSVAENVTVEVAPGELVDSNISALEGTKVGETRELDYVFPAEYEVEAMRGKTAHFKIHVKGLKEQVTPPLDDDFAKEIGGGQTLEEMRAKVRKDLEAAAKTQAAQDEREALLKALVEKNPFDVPKAMVERAIQMMLEGALRNIARSGVDPRQLGLDFGKLRGEMRGRALLEVQGSLLLEAISQSEKIEATDEDVSARVEKLAEESGTSAAQVRQHFKSADERRGLALRVREDKTIEFLKAQANHG